MVKNAKVGHIVFLSNRLDEASVMLILSKASVVVMVFCCIGARLACPPVTVCLLHIVENLSMIWIQ